jgi:hypothetical protein
VAGPGLPGPYIDVPGAIAQLGERLLCKQEVTGSIPVGSIAKRLQISGFLTRDGVPRPPMLQALRILSA